MQIIWQILPQVVTLISGRYAQYSFLNMVENTRKQNFKSFANIKTSIAHVLWNYRQNESRKIPPPPPLTFSPLQESYYSFVHFNLIQSRSIYWFFRKTSQNVKKCPNVIIFHFLHIRPPGAWTYLNQRLPHVIKRLDTINSSVDDTLNSPKK